MELVELGQALVALFKTGVRFEHCKRQHSASGSCQVTCLYLTVYLVYLVEAYAIVWNVGSHYNLNFDL